jgi:hypothetical protein
VSSAAREPLRADALPDLLAAQAMVHEAAPDPPQGPIRDALADDAAARVDRAVGLMETAVGAYNERLAAVVDARMRGPKARKGTKFWSPDQVKVVSGRGVMTLEAHKTRTGIEYKALDAGYVLPDRTVNEIADSMRPVGLRIVADAASSVAKALGRPNTGLAAFDWSQIEAAVDSAVEQMLGAAGRQAQEVRRAVLDADSTAADLDEAIDRVGAAVRRGGNWLLIYGRTLATALAGDAALGAAWALGVTHTQWLSRRDGRVRHTHVTADGQERPVGSKFTVGAFRLRFPADPEVLPAGAAEVMNCRCGLIFARPAPDKQRAVELTEHGTPGPARQLLAARPVGAMTNDDTELGGISVPVVHAPSDVVGYRALDAELPIEPGQRVSWPGTLALALAPPAVAGAAMLTVAIPAGTAIGAAGGVAVLPAGASLSVVSVAQGQVVAQPVMPPTVPA